MFEVCQFCGMIVGCNPGAMKMWCNNFASHTYKVPCFEDETNKINTNEGLEDAQRAVGDMLRHYTTTMPGDDVTKT